MTFSFMPPERWIPPQQQQDKANAKHWRGANPDPGQQAHPQQESKPTPPKGQSAPSREGRQRAL